MYESPCVQCILVYLLPTRINILVSFLRDPVFIP